MKIMYFVQFEGHDGGWMTQYEVIESRSLVAAEKEKILNLIHGETMAGDGVTAYREDS
jgi:hypothetical protein